MIISGDSKELTIEKRCPFCGDYTQLIVPSKEYDLWYNGIPAIKAFPNLTLTECEVLISGICPNCQDKIFSSDEDDEDEEEDE